MEELIAKFLTNNASVSEIEMLEDWLKIKENQKLFEEYVKVNFTSNHQVGLKDFQERKKFLLDRANVRQMSYGRKSRKIYRFAAIFIGLIALTVYFLREVNGNMEEEIGPAKLVISDEKVILRKSNGEVQVLDEEANAVSVYDTEGNVVAHQRGSRVSYEDDLGVGEPIYNEMVVPYGKRFQLVLSDGTNVHLNSGTSLRYPVKFVKGGDRKVFLDGEAFFDVVRNKNKSFTVNSNGIDVEVLGTKFNISSYGEEESIQTVLVEGKVKVKGSGMDSEVLLRPNQMASWNKQERSMGVEQVDVTLHTAWMEGKLVLRKKPFRIIRQKLEKHYNVSIINNNQELDDLKYNVNFDNETIEQVLKTLNENFEIDYRITDNKVIIN